MQQRVGIGIALCGLLSCGPAVVPADLAIVHATVLDVTSGLLLPDHSVLVAGDRIVAMGPTGSLRTTSDALEVDATGLFVTPGLWDAHVHSAAATSWHFPLLVAHGITSVRNMHTSADSALHFVGVLKEQLAAGDIIGPRFLANGAIVDGSPPVWPNSHVARNEAEGRELVASLVEGGADFIKVYDRLSIDAYRGVLAQAEMLGIPVDGHVPVDVPPEEAAAAGQRTVEHTSGITMGCSPIADSLRGVHAGLMESFAEMSFPEDAIAFFSLVSAAAETRDSARCLTTVRAYQEHDVAVTPTSVAYRDPGIVMEDEEHTSLLPAAIREQWLEMVNQGDPIGSIMAPVLATFGENIQLLNQSGVTILAGSDLGNPFLVPGMSLHDELFELVDTGGLTPLEALRAATMNPARVFEMSDSLGEVVPGMLADLVLLEANPLEHIENTRAISGVVLRGRLYDRTALDALMAEATQN